MKNRVPKGALVVLLFLIVLGVVGVYERSRIRTYIELRRRPEVPVAVPFVPRIPSSTSPAVVTSTVPSTTKPMPTSVPSTTTDPFAWSGPLPAQVNLAVPFLSQAPTKNWDMPYQEACEEASMLMVHAFYEGQTTTFAPSVGDKAILDLVAYEESKGKTPDLTAREVAEIMKAKWGYTQVLVKTPVDVDTIKRALANGYPVMLPADGKAIQNPRFRNGGPPYHMLVIKGYVGDNYWITNDPGTQYGSDFTYPIDRLPAVAHDWNGGDVPHGTPVMVVAIPRVH